MTTSDESPAQIKPMLRARCDRQLKARVARLAGKRQCDESDILREATVQHLDAEETRLGLPPMNQPAA